MDKTVDDYLDDAYDRFKDDTIFYMEEENDIL